MMVQLYRHPHGTVAERPPPTVPAVRRDSYASPGRSAVGLQPPSGGVLNDGFGPAAWNVVVSNGTSRVSRRFGFRCNVSETISTTILLPLPGSRKVRRSPSS